MIDSELMHRAACEYAQSRTEDALNEAAKACLPLCAVIARRFSGRGVDEEDLYQTAAMACVRALRDFDPARGLKFSTYVTPNVTGTVRNYLRDKATLMRTPRGMAEQAARLKKARERLTQTLRREPTAREMADDMKIGVPEVLDLLSMNDIHAVQPLDQKDDEGLSVAERAGFEETGFDKFIRREDLKNAVSGLTEDERTLLALRFSQNLTQRETANKMGLSQMRVSRMERRVISALRSDMEAL